MHQVSHHSSKHSFVLKKAAKVDRGNEKAAKVDRGNEKAAKVDRANEYLNEEKGNGNWKELPVELLELILSGLILDDYKRFQLTCKAWINITPPIQPSLIQSKFISQPLPWLLAFPKDQSSSNIYHPIYGDAYVINFPHEIVGAIVRCAKYGWLLMSQGKYSHFFFNPSTMETIKLPDHHVSLYYFYPFVNISFSSPPTSSDCVVLGHCDSDIVVYRKSDDTWYEHSCFGRLSPSYCNQVFCDGLFYSLSLNGKLGVFNPNETKEENMWRDFPNTIIQEFSSKSTIFLMIEFVRSYIVEYDSEIFSIFVGHWGKPVRVYKLDRSKMSWERLESLGDKVIFLCQTASILMPAPLKGIENRIYFPRFQGRDNVFYSLSTGKYHSFRGKDSREDWMNTSEY
ncbi:Sec1-like protein, partial [Thalictrum thalictroides]